MQLKRWLADALSGDSCSSLSQICEEVANKWKGGNDYRYLKITAIVMIIRNDKYEFDEKVDDLLGVYMEYALNDDYLCICKWTN